MMPTTQLRRQCEWRGQDRKPSAMEGWRRLMRQMGVRAEWTSTCCHEDADRVRKAGARAVWMLPSAQHCRVTCSSAAVPPTDGTTISVGNTTHLLSLGNLHKAVSQTPAKWEARRQSSTQWLCNPARFPLHHTTLADT